MRPTAHQSFDSAFRPTYEWSSALFLLGKALAIGCAGSIGKAIDAAQVSVLASASLCASKARSANSVLGSVSINIRKQEKEGKYSARCPARHNGAANYILVGKIGLSSRAFSELIGESPPNTHNYIGARQVEPRASYLMKGLAHFSNINPAWLMLGEGEPFREDTNPSQNQTNNSGKKSTASMATTINSYHLADCEKERNSDKAERDSLAKQVELLHGQLTTKDALIASKAETTVLLRTVFNRPG